MANAANEWEHVPITAAVQEQLLGAMTDAAKRPVDASGDATSSKKTTTSAEKGQDPKPEDIGDLDVAFKDLIRNKAKEKGINPKMMLELMMQQFLDAKESGSTALKGMPEPVTPETVISVGKYKTKTVAEMMKDVNYVKWVIENTSEEKGKGANLLAIKEYLLKFFKVIPGDTQKSPNRLLDIQTGRILVIGKTKVTPEMEEKEGQVVIHQRVTVPNAMSKQEVEELIDKLRQLL